MSALVLFRAPGGRRLLPRLLKSGPSISCAVLGDQDFKGEVFGKGPDELCLACHDRTRQRGERPRQVRETCRGLTAARR